MTTQNEQTLKVFLEQDILPAMKAEVERLRPELAAEGMTASDPVLLVLENPRGEEYFEIEVTVRKGERVRAFLSIIPLEDLPSALSDSDIKAAEAVERIRAELNFQCQGPDHKKLDWWPVHMKRVLATLGTALDSRRLDRRVLAELPTDFVANHTIFLEHVPHDEALRQVEHYRLDIGGQLYQGGWNLDPDHFENLLREAAKARREGAV